MQTIVLSNQKGGVGKTTTAGAIAAGLHAKGKRVLMVDNDPQSNLSYACGVDTVALGEKTLYKVLKGSMTIGEAITHLQDGYDITTLGIEGAAADMELVSETGREYKLKEALAELSDNYDFCIIDTQPTLGVLTINALTAADFLIVPLNADVFSLQGLTQLSGFIDNVRKYTNKELKVSGLLITKYKERQNITGVLSDLLGKAADELGTQIFDTKIRESVAVKENQLLQQSILEGKAAAAQDYKAFVDELMAKEGF